ncbi:Na(+)/citrate cotransporter-like isoform X2 [Ptychodera flava]
MYPLLGILTMADVCGFYMVEFIVLFIAIMLIASAVQRYGLHRRIALRALLLAGSDPKRLLLALMVVTGFLSMWIFNLALVSMMVPIVVALVDQMSTPCTDMSGDEKVSDEEKAHNGTEFSLEAVTVESNYHEDKREVARDIAEVDDILNNSTEILNNTGKADDMEKEGEESQKNLRRDLTTCFNIGLVYSAIIGGAASLVGNIIQVIMNANLQIYYNSEAKISFGNWMLFSTPIQLVSLLLGWTWLALFYLDLKMCILNCFRKRKFKSGCGCKGKENHEEDSIVRILRKEYSDMGPMTWAENTITMVFVFLILVWFLEEPNFMPGWNDLFPPGYVESSTITAGVALICFILPSKRPKINILDEKPYTGLLEWKSAEATVPWGLFVFAGGLLSSLEATKVTGLADIIGDQFEFMASLPYWLVLLVVTALGIVLTEFMSASIIMAVTIPVLARIALEQDINPHYFMLSLTLSLNLAFCLPAGSIVNAVVISNGSVTTFQMIKTGVVMNLLCLVVLNIGVNTYGWWLLNFDDVPAWAFSANFTSVG